MLRKSGCEHPPKVTTGRQTRIRPLKTVGPQLGQGSFLYMIYRSRDIFAFTSFCLNKFYWFTNVSKEDENLFSINVFLCFMTLGFAVRCKNSYRGRIPTKTDEALIEVGMKSHFCQVWEVSIRSGCQIIVK